MSRSSSPYRLRALVLDFDGTIADTEAVEFAATAAVHADHGLTLDEATWARVIGTVGHDWVTDLEAALGAPVDRAAVVARRRAVVRAGLAAIGPLPGVRELLHEAATVGVPVAIASNSPAAWVLPLLEQLGVDGHVQAVACVDDVEHPKPAPDVYLLATARLGVDPGTAVAIEDSATGVAAARAAGLAVVAVPSGLSRYHDVSAAHAVLPGLAGVTLAELDEVLLSAHG